MSEEERNKLIKGLEWAEYETLKMKAMRGEMVLQDNDKGEIIRVSQGTDTIVSVLPMI